MFFASPGFVAALLDTDTPADALASVRATVTAGESLPADLQRRFSERFGHPVLDGIGSTEALHIFLSNTLDDQRPGTSGWPVQGYQAKLVDDSGAVVVEDVDTPGYLHVRGPSVASGYWQRPEATAAAFLDDGWLRTGERVRAVTTGRGRSSAATTTWSRPAASGCHRPRWRRC